MILWAAANRSDGDLSGLSVEDIELAAEWTGADGAFVLELLSVRFIEGAEGSYQIHDWAEHNPWAAGAGARSAKARWNAAKRHHGEAEADRLVPEYAAIRSERSNASSNDAAERQDASSNAPSPSPSPSPSQRTKSTDDDLLDQNEAGGNSHSDDCPHKAIIELYHECLPQLRRVRDWTEKRSKLLRSRWRESEDRQQLDWWRRLFEYIRTCDFLMGRTKEAFECDLEWIISPSNFVKIIEGKYQNRQVVA